MGAEPVGESLSMTLAVFLVVAALWQEPPAASAHAGGPTVTDIVWIRRPIPEFPERAVQARVWAGDVRVRCSLTRAGRFADCQVIEETPAQAGFGPAALSAMRSARFEPAAAGPQPGDAYEATLRFQAPPSQRRR